MGRPSGEAKGQGLREGLGGGRLDLQMGRPVAASDKKNNLLLFPIYREVDRRKKEGKKRLGVLENAETTPTEPRNYT